MRDPARIERILAALRVVWLGSPDLRLGQIVENARHMSTQDNASMTYDTEDRIIEDGLHGWIKTREGSSAFAPMGGAYQHAVAEWEAKENP